jgi:uncharacterized membrane protein
MTEKEELYRLITDLTARLDDLRTEMVQVRERVAQLDGGPVAPPANQPPDLLAMFKKLDAELGLPPVQPSPEEGKTTQDIPPQTETGQGPVPPRPKPKAPPRPKPQPKPQVSLEEWVSKNLKFVGIGVFVLGMVFFVKYAIDNDWIGESGRILTGALTGAGLLGLAHYLRLRYQAFSSVLVGGGVAILYFSFYWAYQQYNLLGQVPTFGIMVAITGFTVAISLAYNRQELTVIAAIGGFATPFLASRGEGNYVVLFSYLTLLNLGILAIAFYKKWHWPNVVAYVLTILVFWAWLGAVSYKDTFPHTGAFVFATVFYSLFFATNVAYNVRHNAKFGVGETMLLLSNQLFYFLAGMTVIGAWLNSPLGGAFAGALAIVNLGLAYLFYRPAFVAQRVDKLLVYLLLGSGLTFASLIGPIWLRGNAITLFWAAECCLLWWLGQRSGLRLFREASVLVLGLMGVSLLLDWQAFYGQPLYGYNAANQYVRLAKAPVLLHPAFLGSVGAFLALLGLRWLSAQDPGPELGLARAARERVLTLALFGLAYLALLVELYFQSINLDWSYQFATIVSVGYSAVFVLVMWWFAGRLGQPYFGAVCAGASALVLLAYPFKAHSDMVSARNAHLMGELSAWPFALHYVVLALFGGLAYLLFRYGRGMQARHLRTGLWVACGLLVFHASAEFSHAYVLLLHQPGLYPSNLGSDSQELGYVVLWGLCSLGFMLAGIRWQHKDLRLISLSLFGLALAKFFLFDFMQVNLLGRIISLVGLGAILLLVAFLYERLKRLIFGDKKADAGEESPS